MLVDSLSAIDTEAATTGWAFLAGGVATNFVDDPSGATFGFDLRMTGGDWCCEIA